MENYKELLLLSVSKQGMNMEIHEIPFNVVLDGGVIIPYCFWTYERDDILEVMASDIQGYGEIKIIQKKNILYISLCYEDDEEEQQTIDVMYN